MCHSLALINSFSQTSIVSPAKHEFSLKTAKTQSTPVVVRNRMKCFSPARAKIRRLVCRAPLLRGIVPPGVKAIKKLPSLFGGASYAGITQSCGPFCVRYSSGTAGSARHPLIGRSPGASGGSVTSIFGECLFVSWSIKTSIPTATSRGSCAKTIRHREKNSFSA